MSSGDTVTVSLAFGIFDHISLLNVFFLGFIQNHTRLTKEPAEVTVKRLERGLLLVCRGFPPAGEKLEILWYGFKEEMAKRHAASNHPAYVYQTVRLLADTRFLRFSRISSMFAELGRR